MATDTALRGTPGYLPSDVEAPVGQVTRSIDMLRDAVSRAWNVQDAIFQRLNKVTRAQSEDKVCGEAELPQIWVPTADDIREMAEQLDRINSNYMDLLNRIEL